MILMRREKAVWLMTILLFFGLNPGKVSGEKLGKADSSVYPRVVSLNGVWEFQGISEMSFGGIVPEDWVGLDIPKMDSAKEGMHFGAYRKTFKNPKGREGERVFVHFQGVAFACEVYLNGQLMGRHGPTLEPFELELTRELKEENELVVLVQDWTAGISRTPVLVWIGNSF